MSGSWGGGCVTCVIHMEDKHVTVHMGIWMCVCVVGFRFSSHSGVFLSCVWVPCLFGGGHKQSSAKLHMWFWAWRRAPSAAPVELIIQSLLTDNNVLMCFPIFHCVASFTWNKSIHLLCFISLQQFFHTRVQKVFKCNLLSSWVCDSFPGQFCMMHGTRSAACPPAHWHWNVSFCWTLNYYFSVLIVVICPVASRCESRLRPTNACCRSQKF